MPFFGNSRGVPSCMIVNDNFTQTAIGSGTTALNTFHKVGLDTVLYDSEKAADINNSQIIVPTWANFVKVTGHIDFPPQANGNSFASAHLFRNVGANPVYSPTALTLIASGKSFQVRGVDSDSPTPEAYYHDRVYYSTLTTGQYISVIGTTGGWIPVMAVNEIWTLYGWQNSGGTVITPQGTGNWLSVEFSE